MNNSDRVRHLMARMLMQQLVKQSYQNSSNQCENKVSSHKNKPTKSTEG